MTGDSIESLRLVQRNALPILKLFLSLMIFVSSKTGIFVIYFEVVRSIRGFEIGWVLVGSWIWVLAKVKIQDLFNKLRY